MGCLGFMSSMLLIYSALRLTPHLTSLSGVLSAFRCAQLLFISAFFLFLVSRLASDLADMIMTFK